MSSLAEMRKELKEMRKSVLPSMPVSRMKKTEVIVELERLRGKAVVPDPEKKTPVASKEKKVVPTKFIKGSPEAKERMAMIRAKKATKKDD